MAKQGTSRNWEHGLVSVFGFLSILFLMGTLVSFAIPDAQTGRPEIALALMCLGPFVGSLGTLAMVLARKRWGPTRKLGTAIPLWLAGTALLGFGGFAALTPGDRSVLSNLGFSFALCLTPGGILTCLGLGAYWYGNLRRGNDGALGAVQADVLPIAEPGLHSAEATQLAGLLQRAEEYRVRITGSLRQKRSHPLSAELAAIPSRLSAWVEQVRRLSDRLTAFSADRLIQGDLARVPGEIASLNDALTHESDPEVKAQLAATLAGYGAQEEELGRLSALMRRTRLQLDETLAHMGTIYSQLQVLDAMELDGARAHRLAGEIEEQVQVLNDLLSATAEVYGSPRIPVVSTGGEEDARRQTPPGKAASGAGG